MVNLTGEQRAEPEALEAMPDDRIDYSDIPEMTAAGWARAQAGMFYNPDWQDITLRISPSGYHPKAGPERRRLVQGTRGEPR